MASYEAGKIALAAGVGAAGSITMPSEGRPKREPSELALALRRQKRVLSLFVFAVLLPAIALGFFGLRALSADKVRVDQLLRREQEEALRDTEARLRAGLEALYAALRSGGSELPGTVVRVLPGGDCDFVKERFIIRARERDPRLEDAGGAIFEAERLEHSNGGLAAASRRYEELAKSQDAYLRSQALLGLARARRRLGHRDAAIDAYGELLDRVPQVLDRESAANLLIAGVSIGDLRREEGAPERALPVLLESYRLLVRGRWILASELVRFYASRLESQLDGICAGSASVSDCGDYEQLRRAKPARLEAIDGLVALHRTLAAGLSSWGRAKLSSDELLLELSGETVVAVRAQGESDGAVVVAAALDEETLANLLLDGGDPGARGSVHVRVASQRGATLRGPETPGSGGSSEARILNAEGLPRWSLQAFHDPDSPPYASRRQLYFGLTAVLVLWLLFGALSTVRSLRQEVAFVGMKTHFVSMVSHEFKSPITSLRALLDGLRGGSVREPERVDQYLGIATSELQRLTRLVNNLLDFSRIEAGTRKYRLVPTNLSALLRDLLVHFDARARELGFRIESRIDDVPAVRADPDAVSQAVLNLLDNAVKSSNGNKWIGVRVFEHGSEVAVEVADRGRGLPTQELDAIIQTASEDFPAEERGLGLGLPIVKHVLSAHGGRVEVRSTPGEGSTFRLLLPRQEATTDADSGR